WNIARFILENTQDANLHAELTESDMQLKQQLADLAIDVTKDMEAYRMYMASEKLYQYAWRDLADKILEESNPILAGEDAVAKASRAATLRSLLGDTLKLLHPFMPFVTEEIWQSLPQHDGMLMVASWPAK